jgi:hypothetical protein
MMMSLLGGATSGATVERGGIHPAMGNRMAVVGSGSAMTVTVDTGLAFVPGTGAFTGPYSTYNDALNTLTVAASSTTQWRRDLIVMQVLDTAFGDGSDAAQLAVIQGANNATSPAPLPTQPSRSLLLAIVNVDPNVTTLSTHISDQRTYMGGLGPVLCTSTTRPSLPAYGQMTVDSDGQQRLSYFDGSVYRYVADSGWVNYTPTLTNWGAATFNQQAGEYKFIGDKVIAVNIALSLTHNGSGTSDVGIGLPFTPDRNIRQQFFGTHSTLGEGSIFSDVGAITAGGSGLFIDRIREMGSTPAYQNMRGQDFLSGESLYLSGVARLA